MELKLIAGGIVLVVIVTGLLLLRKIRKLNIVQKTGTLTEKLQAEKLKSDIILNAIEDGVILADKNQIIQLLNPAAAKLTGWPVNEAVKLNFRTVIKIVDANGEPYPDDRNPLLLAASLGKPAHDNTAFLVDRQNRHIAVNISASPLLDEAKQLTGVVGVFRDVSEERMEEQKRSEFISTASHEMRTPVAAIEGYLALAMNDKVSQIDAKAKEYLTKAHASTQHLGELFQDLLTSAKAEDNRLVNHPEVIEFGNYLEQLTEDLKFVAQKKGLGIEFVKGAPDATKPNYFKVIQPLYYVRVDPNRIREVITNLFDNAVKYTPKGKITIGMTGDTKIVQFFIRDTGAGIPADDIPHLFQKFYRVDSSATRSIGGTGLGLFICRKIVELYNGRIWVESEVNKGSTFYINLPRLTSEQVQSYSNEIRPSEAMLNQDQVSPEPVGVTNRSTT